MWNVGCEVSVRCEDVWCVVGVRDMWMCKGV